MGQEHIQLPKKAIFMVSNRDYRLSLLNGWCQLFKANVPAKVPPHAYRGALEAGIIVAEDIPAAAPTVTEPTPVVTEDPAQRSADIDQAMLIVLTRNDPEDFKKDNTPKAAKVIAELDVSFDPRPTATEIVESYERLQENLDLADD